MYEQYLPMNQDMTQHNEFLRQSDALRDLRALEAIEQDPSVSQRELASQLGVAVGVANACVRTLVRKGMIKIRGESNRSITYHLTKEGLLHKSRLAMEWTRNTVDFYRQARRDVARRLDAIARLGEKGLVLAGDEALAEIGVIVAAEAGVTILAVVLDAPREGEILGVRLMGLDDAVVLEPDAFVACSAAASEKLRHRGLHVHDIVTTDVGAEGE
jgi:DNA-binding MarR family transcriptional regulator